MSPFSHSRGGDDIFKSDQTCKTASKQRLVIAVVEMTFLSTTKLAKLLQSKGLQEPICSGAGDIFNFPPHLSMAPPWCRCLGPDMAKLRMVISRRIGRVERRAKL